MADQIDEAQELEQIMTETALKQYRAPRGPEPNGKCHFCHFPLAAGKRWCDQECRDQWQKEEDLYARKQPTIEE